MYVAIVNFKPEGECHQIYRVMLGRVSESLRVVVHVPTVDLKYQYIFLTMLGDEAVV